MSDITAIMGASTTVRTMADGSLRLAIDIEPRHAQQAFALFGSPGTPVALARITNEAANAFDKRPEPEDHGKHYAVLYKSGWFHNPKVSAAFGISAGLSPEERINCIKDEIYGAFDVESLTEISPASFIEWCNEIGIRATLPAAFGGAA